MPHSLYNITFASTPPKSPHDVDNRVHTRLQLWEAHSDFLMYFHVEFGDLRSWIANRVIERHVTARNSPHSFVHSKGFASRTSRLFWVNTVVSSLSTLATVAPMFASTEASPGCSLGAVCSFRAFFGQRKFLHTGLCLCQSSRSEGNRFSPLGVLTCGGRVHSQRLPGGVVDSNSHRDAWCMCTSTTTKSDIAHVIGVREIWRSFETT